MLWKYKKVYQETNEDVVFTCLEYTLTVEQTDLDNADDGTVYMEYSDCVKEEPTIREHISAGTYQVCIQAETIPLVYVYIDTITVVDIDSVAVNTGSC